MHPLNITDVRAHPGDSAFLLDDGETAILYDSGFAFTGYAVADKIKAALGGRNLDYIFLTHSHYDHALGSVYACRYWPGVKVVAGAYAARIFEKPTARAVMRDLDQKIARQCGVTEYEDRIDDLHVDIPVSDGDTVTAGQMTFTVLSLPGHTKCSVGFYCPERKLLLNSETVGVFNGTDDVVPSYLVGYGMAMDSIARVEQLDIESVLVPHFGVLSGDTMRLYLQKARTSAVETAEKIAAMLRAGLPKEEIVSRFKERYYHGYIRTIYPIDAMELNTGIMIDLIRRELCPEN